jgi:hypothetical protein
MLSLKRETCARTLRPQQGGGARGGTVSDRTEYRSIHRYGQVMEEIAGRIVPELQCLQASGRAIRRCSLRLDRSADIAARSEARLNRSLTLLLEAAQRGWRDPVKPLGSPGPAPQPR